MAAVRSIAGTGSPLVKVTPCAAHSARGKVRLRSAKAKSKPTKTHSERKTGEQAHGEEHVEALPAGANQMCPVEPEEKVDHSSDAAVNAHIAQGLGEDKGKEAEFLQARDYLAGKYRDHFMSEEGLSEAEAVQKVGLFAINVGVEAIRTKQDFVAQGIETARGAGFKLKPGPKAGKNSTAAKKVRKGQKDKKRQKG